MAQRENEARLPARMTRSDGNDQSDRFSSLFRRNLCVLSGFVRKLYFLLRKIFEFTTGSGNNSQYLIYSKRAVLAEPYDWPFKKKG